MLGGMKNWIRSYVPSLGGALLGAVVLLGAGWVYARAGGT